MPSSLAKVLAALPSGLRDPLVDEYRHIVQSYMERRWSPTELSGGRFCEVVFTILDGHARGSYATTPAKPRDFVSACRALENNSNVSRSFQILIPRLLPALYEVRNNRGVGHVGGDVDPNNMDATAVLSLASWIMAELIRVYHGIDIDEAQKIVDSIVERRIPLVWSDGDVKRVLDPKLPLKSQILVLLAGSPRATPVADLLRWCGYEDKGYFVRLLRRMHKERLIELSGKDTLAQILPPGNAVAEHLIGKRSGA
jgi:hypothetical protein